MWKPSKKILLIITITLLVITGVLYQQVDWSAVLKGDHLVKELHLPTLFLLLGLYFLWMYMSKLRTQK